MVVVLKACGVALPGLSPSQQIPQIKVKFKLRDDRSFELGPQLLSGHPPCSPAHGFLALLEVFN